MTQTTPCFHCGFPKGLNVDVCARCGLWESKQDEYRRLPSQTTKYDHKAECHKAAMELSQRTRQQFLNCVWHGASIKEAYETVGISFEAALGIMNMNLVKETTMRLNLVSE